MLPNPLLPHIEATYFALRRGAGIVGIALPFLLALGDLLLESHALRGSISAYYYSRMGNLFVGALCAVGMFLLLYKSYSARENFFLNIAGVSAIGVGLFPTDPNSACGAPQSAMYWLHPTFAVIFFAAIAYVCIFLAGEKLPPSHFAPKKWNRAATYKACGTAMVLFISAAIVLNVLAHFYSTLGISICQLNGLFWFETAAVITFGIYWLAKSGDISDAVYRPGPL